jgi:hypothetical protein
MHTLSLSWLQGDTRRPAYSRTAGNGNVTQGALEIFQELPHVMVDPGDLQDLARNADPHVVYGVLLQREHCEPCGAIPCAIMPDRLLPLSLCVCVCVCVCVSVCVCVCDNDGDDDDDDDELLLTGQASHRETPRSSLTRRTSTSTPSSTAASSTSALRRTSPASSTAFTGTCPCRA